MSVTRSDVGLTPRQFQTFRRNLLKSARSLKTSVNSAVNLPKRHAEFNPVELLEEHEFISVMLVSAELCLQSILVRVIAKRVIRVITSRPLGR